MDIEELIDNQESEELLNIVKKYFNGDAELFFNYIIEENLIPENEVSGSLFDIFPNEYILFLIKQKKYEIVKQYFASITQDITYKDGKYYLEVYPISSLHKLFHRDHQDFVEQILEGDYNYDSYYSDSQKTEDLFDSLTKENKIGLVEFIKETKLNSSLNYDGDSELIESFIQSDNSDNNSFILTVDRLNKIVNSDLLPDLIDNVSDFDELRSDMSNWYSWAESQAYTDEYYNLVYNEIKDFFNIPRSEQLGEYTTTKVYDSRGNSRTRDMLLIDITSMLISYIKESVESSVGYWSNTEEITGNYGSLLDYIYDNITIGRVNFDYVYPSSSSVDELYNQNFYENI